MNRVILMCLISLFAVSCKQGELCEVEKPLNAVFRQGELTEFLDLLKYEDDGTIILSHYNYNFSKSSKYAVTGTFDDGVGVEQVSLNEYNVHPQNGIFQHDDGLVSIGLQSIAPIPNYFGQPLSFQLLSAENSVLLADQLNIPAALDIFIGQDGPNPTFSPGYTLQWNAVPENGLGLYLVFEFNPAANIHLPGPALSEGKHLWYINIPDTGSYTFQESDFPGQLPEGAVIGLRAIRGKIKDYTTGNGSFRFVAHSEVHGFFKFGGHQ